MAVGMAGLGFKEDELSVGPRMEPEEYCEGRGDGVARGARELGGLDAWIDGDGEILDLAFPLTTASPVRSFLASPSVWGGGLSEGDRPKPSNAS